MPFLYFSSYLRWFAIYTHTSSIFFSQRKSDKISDCSINEHNNEIHKLEKGIGQNRIFDFLLHSSSFAKYESNKN